MADVAAFAITPELRAGPQRPSYAGLRSHIRFWRNWVYLGIGELSLTLPVAAFLRSL